MLWYKSWLETRSRFLIGLALLMIVACGTVFDYPAVVKLLPLANAADVGGEVGRLIRESAELSREFRGHVWLEWFRQNLTQMGTLFAVLLGSGGLLSSTAGGTLFTLSLPASRLRILGTRAATGLAELLVLVFIPSLIIPLLSPAIGESYSVVDVLVQGVCLFVAAATFFSLAFLLSTVFTDLWRPLLVACGVALVLAGGELVFRSLAPYGIFHLMTGEDYFRGARLPWAGLLVSAAMSATLLYAAGRNMAQRDF